MSVESIERSVFEGQDSLIHLVPSYEWVRLWKDCKALKEVCLKDKTALYILYQVMNEFDFEKIASAKSSREAWDILEKAYKGNDRLKQVWLQTLKGELESMRMEETEGVAEYISQIKTMTNQLCRNGEKLPTSRVVKKILRSLTDNFKNIVCYWRVQGLVNALCWRTCQVTWGANWVSVSVVVRLGISQKIVDLKITEKRQSISSKKLKKRFCSWWDVTWG